MVRRKTETASKAGTDKPAAGAFLDSLVRNNQQIRADRARTIVEDAELVYRRKIEDLAMEIKRLRRDQESSLDLSPDNAMNLKPAQDFSATAFVEADTSYSIRIREKEIELGLASERFRYLFGKEA